ncbi:unnamed protein product, partial [Meganyctiphanes norvegica]
MDKALERLVHRLDTMEERLAINFNITNQMMHIMESQELSNHVSRIDGKINNIQVSLDSNALPQDELIAEASESYRINIPSVQHVLHKNPSISALQQTLDGVYESCSTIDRRLQYHMDIVNDNLEVLSHNVKDIHLAVIDEPSTGISASEDAIFNNRTMVEPRNKIDLLMSRMDPFVTVWQKMEEVWDVVVGTKTSVDHLVPKSDALLSTSERQERAISVIQFDLNEKANKIIKNLGQMEERLKTIPPNGKADRDHINPISLIRLTHVEEDKPNEQPPPFDLLDQTFLTEISGSDPTVTTTERSDQNQNSRTQSGLVFPSVQKKPVVINSTFVLSDDDSQVKQGYSCSDLMLQGMKESDTYYIKIRGTTYWFLKVYCDMQTASGGWTVIQRREDYGEPRENFIRDWNAYKHGFGNSNEEFWLGNENIYMLTNTEDYILRIELEDFDGNKRYAEYSTFKLHGEGEMYKLEIGGYSGNAGDSLNDPWYGSNLSPFSTYNSDNDRSSLNCASMLKGGWWWRSCGRGLNGLYLTDPNDLTARQGTADGGPTLPFMHRDSVSELFINVLSRSLILLPLIPNGPAAFAKSRYTLGLGAPPRCSIMLTFNTLSNTFIMCDKLCRYSIRSCSRVVF